MEAKLTFPPELVELIADMVAEKLKPLIACNGKHNADDIIFDVQGLAEYLKVEASWVYKKISLKEIPHFHVGKYPRFKKAKIDKWIEDTQTTRTIPPLRQVKHGRRPAD